MQPKAKSNQFTPKWRHFHPQATVWVQNPLDHDVVFQVADEHNVPYAYRMPKGKVSELPGGAVATLGVKAIVDELIQMSATDVFLMWDVNTRSKYESQIILREKQAPVMQEIAHGGEVNLATSDSAFKAEEETIAPEVEDEPAFSGQDEPVDEEDYDGDAQPVNEPPIMQPRQNINAPAHPIVSDIAEASLAGLAPTTTLPDES